MDALTEEGDEGRGLAAISFGELPSKLRSGGFRMGQPYRMNFDNFPLNRWKEHTLGSETSQYQEEKRTIVYSLSSGERNGRSTNSATKSNGKIFAARFCSWGYRLQRWKQVELQNA